MTKENQEIWSRVLGEIETEVSKAIFYNLFKKTCYINITELLDKYELKK